MPAATPLTARRHTLRHDADATPRRDDVFYGHERAAGFTPLSPPIIDMLPFFFAADDALFHAAAAMLDAILYVATSVLTPYTPLRHAYAILSRCLLRCWLDIYGLIHYHARHCQFVLRYG